MIIEIILGTLFGFAVTAYIAVAVQFIIMTNIRPFGNFGANVLALFGIATLGATWYLVEVVHSKPPAVFEPFWFGIFNGLSIGSGVGGGFAVVTCLTHYYYEYRDRRSQPSILHARSRRARS